MRCVSVLILHDVCLTCGRARTETGCAISRAAIPGARNSTPAGVWLRSRVKTARTLLPTYTAPNQVPRSIHAKPSARRWKPYTMNCRLTSTPVNTHITSTAAGHAVHAMAQRKPTRARTETKRATRGRRDESAKKKYEP